MTTPGERHDHFATLATSFAAGVAAVAGSYAVAGPTPGFAAAPVSGALTNLTPGAVVTWAILVLGDLGQRIAFAAALALAVGLFATAVALGRALADRFVPDGAGPPLAAPFGAGVGATTLAFGLSESLAPSLTAGLAAAAVVGFAEYSPVFAPDPSARRRVLQAGAGTIATGAVGVLVGSRASIGGTSNDSGGERETVPANVEDPLVASMLKAARDRSPDFERIDSLVSDLGFYTVDINSVDPAVDADEWTLSVTGAGGTDRTFSFDDLTSMPAEHRFVTLRCVGDPVNGDKTDTALWTGVPVERVLESASVDVDEGCCVMLRAADDYYEEFPLDALRGGFLAYRMNGKPLPRAHGHPVRALVPGHWGEINVKWLTEIELLDRPAEGYWEKRGWHGTGPVNPVAKLHAVETAGGRVRVGGHAYAGTRGIDRVEVSTDGGRTWTEASLSSPLPGRVAADADEVPGTAAADAWRMWSYEYEADRPHEAVVRAVDGTGEVQTEERATPFPSGATGWASRRVEP